MQNRRLVICANPPVLRRLQAEIRCERAGWELALAGSAPEALTALAQSATDVVISELDVPSGNGNELLSQVLKCYPKTLRFILSDVADTQSALRCLGSPHYAVPNPWTGRRVTLAVERAIELEQWSTNDAVKKMLWHVQKLPSPPSIYFELARELQSPYASTEDVANIVQRDPMITAKLLQLVNSAAVGRHDIVTDPVSAVMLLGMSITKSVVLLAHTFSYFDQISRADFSVEELWRHSWQTGCNACDLARAEHFGSGMMERAFTAGLLHDIGKVVLVANLPKEYSQAMRLARQQQLAAWQAELEVFGATHADVGATILGMWSLPRDIIEAVALHHHPARFLNPEFCLLTATHVADVLERWSHPEAGLPAPSLDLDYLGSLHLRERLPLWLEVCESGERGSRT